MPLDQAMIALIPATGLAIVALINLRPKKVSPEQFMSEELKRMSERIGELEESNRTMRAEMQELQSKVSASYYNLHRVKGYAFTLEDYIYQATGALYERPDDVDAIFKDH